MRIDVTQAVYDYEGKPISKNKTDAKGKLVLDADNRPVQESQTIREFFTTALNSATQNETFTAEQKAKAYQISLKLWAGKEANLTLDDRAFLKERINLIFINPMLCGRLCDILEGNEATEVESVQKPA